MSNTVIAWVTSAGVLATAIILGIKALLPHVRDLLDEVAKTIDKWREIRRRSGEQPTEQVPKISQDDRRSLEGLPGQRDVPAGRVGGVPDPLDRNDPSAL
ncbi:hypothetical protein [Embleya hyalina]|uniref:hypothetical protein n=1 Tax=Embleya hyalina TaxID=516124 RepID=UPI000F829B36|nr:hypothetical protein [Embleya hyalina]